MVKHHLKLHIICNPLQVYFPEQLNWQRSLKTHAAWNISSAAGGKQVGWVELFLSRLLDSVIQVRGFFTSQTPYTVMFAVFPEMRTPSEPYPLDLWGTLVYHPLQQHFTTQTYEFIKTGTKYCKWESIRNYITLIYYIYSYNYITSSQK